MQIPMIVFQRGIFFFPSELLHSITSIVGALCAPSPGENDVIYYTLLQQESTDRCNITKH